MTAPHPQPQLFPTGPGPAPRRSGLRSRSRFRPGDRGYVCGPPEAATGPGFGHAVWHYERGEPACGAALRAEGGARAAWKGIRWEDFEYKPRRVADYVCGPAELATEPGQGHRSWHKRRGERPCAAANAAAAWARAGGAPGWKPWKKGDPRLAARKRYVCGDVGDRTRPNQSHRLQHLRDGTPICGAADEEARHYSAQHKAGRPLPDWEPGDVKNGRAVYVCGPAEDATEPGLRHWTAHYHRGEVPCGRSVFERNWARHGGVPGWEPGDRRFLEAPTRLYRFRFADGMTYWGITAQSLGTRWSGHWGSDSPLGRKLRAGELFVAEAVAVFPNRAEAEAAERDRIAAVPAHLVLNVLHARRS